MKWLDYLKFLPEVKKPEKKLGFNDKLKWTITILILYFLLSVIPLYGLNPDYVAQFESLSVLLAAKLGSLISLGIGPIVSGSIILQLLNGAGIININTQSKEGREQYQLLQKGVNVFFIIFMNAMYVLSGAIPPAQGTALNIALLIIQLVLGGLLLMLFDEITSKWGFGSGISLFIAAGVSQQIFVTALSPIINQGTGYFVGYIPLILQLFVQGNPGAAIWPALSIIATVGVFLLVVFAQSIKVNIPLTMGRVRGYNIKWPIKFFYTSNIPVIFTASFIAMIQIIGLFMSNAGMPLLGEFAGQKPISGLALWLQFPSIQDLFIQGIGTFIPQLIIYPLFMILGSIGFSVLWLQVGGQDAASVAGQIYETGLSIPGFRRDKRILERVLSRYINPLAILGAAIVGLLAVIADLFSALTRGTGILLAVMIIYGIYENIARTGLDNASPAVKKLFEAL